MAEETEKTSLFSNNMIDMLFEKTEEYYDFQAKIWGIRGNIFMAFYYDALLQMTKSFQKLYDESSQKQ